jgi:hypothetical protein
MNDEVYMSNVLEASETQERRQDIHSINQSINQSIHTHQTTKPPSLPLLSNHTPQDHSHVDTMAAPACKTVQEYGLCFSDHKLLDKGQLRTYDTSKAFVHALQHKC